MTVYITETYQYYRNNLPEAILPTICKSACFTFAIAVLLLPSGNGKAMDFTNPLLKAGVAALASSIHALMTPLFNKIFGCSCTDKPFSEFAKSCTVAFLASALVGLSMNSSLQLSAFKLFYLISSNSFITFFMAPKDPQKMPENSTYFCF